MNPLSLQSAIGILDSGVGGLTVAKEVLRQLPREKILYFGDTCRCPYGPRTPAEVRQFTTEIVHFLSGYSMKALVIACNTATAVALESIRQQFSIPVLGVIEPGARAAIKASRQGRIGVIGTQGTVKSEAYHRALKLIDPDLVVVSHACPALVPLVESGSGDTDHARSIVKKELLPLKEYELDTLIMGCTHYPLISDWIQREMGPSVTLISSAEETARELSTVLQHKGLLTDQTMESLEPMDHHFFTSGTPESFRRIAESWLGHSVRVEQVILDTLTNHTAG
ncbi:glutamate racemase [Paludifilum halophilum]|uniref:Glutamate racemase n=1 Tax=Paludifilum halophilum TaxID=1642702 RepID=A0A235B7L5_9BACL|nr:glutamate racemase [Paludifilum halophilum]OYD08300.1 glutamate racemase [Paludifilum halophilum]